MFQIKKIAFLITILSIIQFSQAQTYNTGLVFVENVIRKNDLRGNNSFNGTPYSDETFQPATIAPINQLFLVRYNAAEDQIEVNLDEKGILILDESAADYTITFNKDGKKYIILEGPDNNLGYYVLLKEFSNLSLYSKEAKTFYPKEEAMSSYQTEKPARYSDLQISYFYKSNKEGSELIEVSLKKSSIYKAFPDQKNNLKAFFKKNNITLGEETDLIKVFQYLNNTI